MARTRRQIIYGRPYELTFRVREGLPFVRTQYMSTIIHGIMARAQRDEKVTLCAYVVMGNHWHVIIVAKDAEQANRYYKELKKALTEATKRLLGVKHLSMWERSSVILLPTPDDVVGRLSYIFANPAAADLVETISEYPGLSSWGVFDNAPHQTDASVTSEHFWINASMIPRAPKSITSQQDIKITTQMEKNAHKKHDLVIEPHAWMECFDLNEGEVDELVSRVRGLLDQLEEEARAKRRSRKAKVFGAARLRLGVPSISGHKPKKNEPAIFVICHDPSLRTQIITQFKEFCADCADCYRRWRERAENVVWPPGAFLPPLGRTYANAIICD